MEAQFQSQNEKADFEPLGWLCALYSSAAGPKNRSRGSFAAISMKKYELH
jgi:hypothetical protein